MTSKDELDRVKKSVLIVVSSLGQYPELFRIARLLKDTSKYKPILYFNQGVHESNVYVANCLNYGIDILDYRFGHIEGMRISSSQKSVVEVIQEQQHKIQKESNPDFKLKSYIKQNLPMLFKFLKTSVYFIYKNIHLLGFFYRVAVKLRRAKREKSIIDAFKIDLMVFAEDSEDYFTPQLIEVGHKKGIKSVVFPYTFANQFEFLEDAYFNDRRVNKNILNCIAGYFFPKWTYFYKNKKLLKSTASFIFATELFKRSPPNPWVMSSGYADVIAVESKFMREYYHKAGIPSDQMLETGYLSLDQLSHVSQKKNEIKADLAKCLGIDANKPWVVCAVPPSQWPRAGVGFSTYDDFLNKFLGLFKQFKEVEVLFKFHPRLDLNDIKKLCEKHKIIFVENDTVELVGISNAYIASVSSTIRWVLALGIPTINYDLYAYRYGDFDSAKNYKTVERFEDFEKAVQDLYNQCIEKDKMAFVVQAEYGQLDGKAKERILKLFGQLTS
jgi:hypothetical protein